MRCAPAPAELPARHGRPAARHRALMEGPRALALSRLFKMFANDTRLRLLHALERGGEVCVTDLAARVEMAPQAVSNQLQRLADRGIVAARRDGTRLYYRIANPCVGGFLDLGLCFLDETIERSPRGGEPTVQQGMMAGKDGDMHMTMLGAARVAYRDEGSP